jgi:hypothetical protein
LLQIRAFSERVLRLSLSSVAYTRASRIALVSKPHAITPALELFAQWTFESMGVPTTGNPAAANSNRFVGELKLYVGMSLYDTSPNLQLLLTFSQ